LEKITQCWNLFKTFFRNCADLCLILQNLWSYWFFLSFTLRELWFLYIFCAFHRVKSKYLIHNFFARDGY
jgi:hypothetical protein